jgi:hypothetical protein
MMKRARIVLDMTTHLDGSAFSDAITRAWPVHCDRLQLHNMTDGEFEAFISRLKTILDEVNYGKDTGTHDDGNAHG